MYYILFIIIRVVWEVINNLIKIRGVFWFFNICVKRLIINCYGYFIDKKNVFVIEFEFIMSLILVIWFWKLVVVFII